MNGKIPIKSAHFFARDVSALVDYLKPVEFEKPVEVIIKPFKSKRSINQNNLFHMWVGEISDYLIRHGRVDWNEEKTKENLKRTFLGVEKSESVNMITGERTVQYVTRHTSDLDIGDMHYFMNQVFTWTLDALGFSLTIPEDSEFMKLRNQQNE